MASREDSSSVLAQSNMDFCCKLYMALKDHVGPLENILFSPSSLAVALALIHAGAADETADEISSVLSLPKTEDETCNAVSECLSIFNDSENAILHMANGLFIREDINVKESFIDMAKNLFQCFFAKLNFGGDNAKKVVNEFIQQNQARGKNVHPFSTECFNHMTNLVIVNTIYFRGFWSTAFDPEYTFNGTFYLNEDDEVRVDFMTQSNDFRIGYQEEVDTSVIVLPYEDGNLSMVLLIPNTINGLLELENNLPSLNLIQIAKDTLQEEVILTMPKFRISKSMNLKEPLVALGVRSMFTNQANLSGITDDEQLFVNEVIQKAFMEVSEEGTETTSAAGVDLMVLRMPFEIIADHPFMFYIIDNNSEIPLFMGRFVRP